VDEKEFNNVYAIPANYTDSGKLFGGMLEVRNTIEAIIILLIIGYPQLMWMNVPLMIKIVIMTVTLLPIGIISLMGVGGDSLIQFFIHVITFWMRRRRLHLRRVGYRYEQSTTKQKKARKN
jgi:hypothetical protein